MNAPFDYRTFFLLWISHFFIDFFLGIWPIYKTLTHIDLAHAGLIMAIAGFTGEILQLFFGFICDQGYRKKVLLFGLCMGSCILFITFTNTLINIFLLMLCVTIGSASFHPAAIGAASQLFPKKGRSILFFTSGGALGLGISQIAFTKCLDLFNGHAYPLFIPIIILALIWMFYPLEEKNRITKRATFKEFIVPFVQHRKKLTLLYFTQVTSYGVFLSFLFMLPDILQVKQVDPWLFKGGGHMCFVFGAVFGMVVMGFLCDRWGYKNLLIANIICALTLLALFLYVPISSTILLALLLACLGIPLYLMNPFITAWGNQLIPESPSTVSALLMGFAWCVSNVVPCIGGYCATHLPIQPIISTMGMISLLMIISLICILRIAKIPDQVVAKEETSGFTIN